jgi:hypothetical protein
VSGDRDEHTGTHHSRRLLIEDATEELDGSLRFARAEVMLPGAQQPVRPGVAAVGPRQSRRALEELGGGRRCATARGRDRTRLDRGSNGVIGRHGRFGEMPPPLFGVV